MKELKRAEARLAIAVTNGFAEALALPHDHIEIDVARYGQVQGYGPIDATVRQLRRLNERSSGTRVSVVINFTVRLIPEIQAGIRDDQAFGSVVESSICNALGPSVNVKITGHCYNPSITMKEDHHEEDDHRVPRHVILVVLLVAAVLSLIMAGRTVCRQRVNPVPPVKKVEDHSNADLKQDECPAGGSENNEAHSNSEPLFLVLGQKM